jgi:hypothetical protein
MKPTSPDSNARQFGILDLHSGWARFSVDLGLVNAGYSAFWVTVAH